MASYRFISVATNAPVNLAQIDDEVCAFYGDKSHTTNNHPCYTFLVEVGFGILLMSSGANVNQQAFDAWVEKRLKPAVPELDQDPKWIKHLEMLRRFLYQDYTFEAWR